MVLQAQSTTKGYQAGFIQKKNTFKILKTFAIWCGTATQSTQLFRTSGKRAQPFL